MIVYIEGRAVESSRDRGAMERGKCPNMIAGMGIDGQTSFRPRDMDRRDARA